MVKAAIAGSTPGSAKPQSLDKTKAKVGKNLRARGLSFVGIRFIAGLAFSRTGHYVSVSLSI